MEGSIFRGIEGIEILGISAGCMHKFAVMFSIWRQDDMLDLGFLSYGMPLALVAIKNHGCVVDGLIDLSECDLVNY